MDLLSFHLLKGILLFLQKVSPFRCILTGLVLYLSPWDFADFSSWVPGRAHGFPCFQGLGPRQVQDTFGCGAGQGGKKASMGFLMPSASLVPPSVLRMAVSQVLHPLCHWRLGLSPMYPHHFTDP